MNGDVGWPVWTLEGKNLIISEGKPGSGHKTPGTVIPGEPGNHHNRQQARSQGSRRRARG